MRSLLRDECSRRRYYSVDTGSTYRAIVAIPSNICCRQKSVTAVKLIDVTKTAFLER